MEWFPGYEAIYSQSLKIEYFSLAADFASFVASDTMAGA